LRWLGEGKKSALSINTVAAAAGESRLNVLAVKSAAGLMQQAAGLPAA
jgi:hypothetical protein